MSDRVEMVIEQILERSPHTATCVVRCAHGAISPGFEFRGVLPPGHDPTAPLAVVLVVAEILRYGRPVDLIDPPHSGIVRFTGNGLTELGAGARLVRVPRASDATDPRRPHPE